MNTEEYHLMHAVESDHFWFWAKLLFLRISLASLKVPRDSMIADIGCGSGLVLESLQRWGYRRATGIDSSPIAFDICRKKLLNVALARDTSLPFDDNSLDCIVCLDVLEHIQDDHAAVNQFYAKLRSGGTVIAMVPAHQHLWSYHDEALGHFRRYTRTQFEQLFSSAGFTCRQSTYIHATLYPFLCIIRKIRRQHRSSPSSDTSPLPFPLNLLAKIAYLPELIIFWILGRLPIGSSVLIAAIKP